MANIKYISSDGVEFNMLDFQVIKLHTANFHKVTWTPETITRQFGTKINRFTKPEQRFSCLFKFKGNPADRKKQIDDFIFQTEQDIAREKPGAIWWNDQYINIYFISHSTHPEGSGIAYTQLEGEFYAPYPFWIEEQTAIIRPSEESAQGFPADVKGYPADRQFKYGYNPKYSYPYAKTAVYLRVDSALPANYRAVVYGPTPKVQFSISGHLYEVNYSLRAGQIMIIDSRDYIPITERCMVVNENGTTINVFDYRNPNSLLFEKVPNGDVVLNYSRTYGIDLTLYQERSAPI